MTSPYRSKLKCLSLFFLGLFACYVNAQKPNWIPVAELLLGSMGSADPDKMAEVMNRCTALNMTLSALTSNESAEISQGYENQALRLIQNGIMIEMNSEKERTGIEPNLEQVSDLAVSDVKEMLGTYNTWIDENFAEDGSYFSNDLEIEMKSCELATKIVMHRP
jgi:hypothetical protein